MLSKIRGVDITNILKTDTNQIDGFSITYINTIFPSIFNVMVPVFYCECKNEPENPPNITYYQKLQAIIDKSRVAKLGIVFSRKKATKEAKDYSKQLYLINGIVIININDDDWKNIIENRMNALKLIHIKYAEIVSFAQEKIDLIEEFQK